MFYGTVLHIIVTYIKENKSDFTGCCSTNTEHQITKLQKLHSPPRNRTAGNKLPVPFFWKPFCMGNLLPTCKIFIERPDSLILSNQKKGVLGYSLFAYGPYQGLY